MGRYAFFTTGIEYKFWFAIQESADITRFGGITKVSSNCDYLQEWKEEDKEYALQALRLFERRHDIPPFDISSYEANVKETERLKEMFYGNLFDRYLSEQEQAYYCLGWLIYHQLTYEPNLSCTFET